MGVTVEAGLPTVTSISTAVERVVQHAPTVETRMTNYSPDETPTVLGAATSCSPRRIWTLEEDVKLAEAVKKYGKDWVAAAAMVYDRTRHQCHQRWTRSLDSANNGKKAGTWTPKEDEKLVEAVKKHGNDWVAVAAMVPSRTSSQCYNRWTHALHPSNNGKKPLKWEPEEDVKLTQSVKMHGNDWVAVAQMVPGRARHQCYKRWTDALNPSNNGKKAGTWNPEEDRKLAKAVKIHGNDWVAVATLVPGRTNNQCHIRWTRSLDSFNNGTKAGT
jgi:hypothetical protein